MVLMWMLGTFGSMSGCSQMNYLRGANELPATIDRMLSDAPGDDTRGLDVTSPLVRTGLIREKARLAALADHQRRAFPVALAQAMLGALLVIAALSVMTRRRGWRTLALQFVAANAVFAVVTYALLAPVREAMTAAVAAELAHASESDDTADATDASALASRRKEVEAAELQSLVLQLAAFGAAAFALTRPRTRAYFEAGGIDARTRGGSDGA